MQDCRLLVADAAEIAAKSRLQAKQLWQRF
jgi:hypothetical protein